MKQLGYVTGLLSGVLISAPAMLTAAKRSRLGVPIHATNSGISNPMLTVATSCPAVSRPNSRLPCWMLKRRPNKFQNASPIKLFNTAYQIGKLKINQPSVQRSSPKR